MNKLVTLIPVWLMISGCGLVKSAKHEEAGVENSDRLAESLNLRIVRAGTEDAMVPDPALDLKSARVIDKTFVNGDALVFQDNVYLPDSAHPQAIFLVWSEDWMGTQIQNAIVEHRLEDERNEPSGPAVRQVALFDTLTRRWYLPFTSFTSNLSAGADPSRQHLLSLDLQTADGARHLVHVRMRVVGSAPEIEVLNLNPTAERSAEILAPSVTPDLLQQAKRIGKEGIVVRTTQVFNPAQRVVRLWLTPGLEPRLALRSYVGQVTYRQDRMAPGGPVSLLLPPLLNPIRWQTSDAQFSVTQVRITLQGDPKPRLLPVREGRWATFDLTAGARGTLEWLAFPAQGTPHCDLPSPPTHHMEWANGRHFCFEFPITDTCYHQAVDQADLAEPWVVGQMQWKGDWKPSMLAANPWDKSLENPGQTSRDEVGFTLNGPSGESGGEVVGAYVCQGAF